MDHKDKSPLITFSVGDKSFQSDVSALQYFTKNLNNELRMDFGFSLGNDWSKQPDKDLEHYRQRMCAYIENTYSNIVIAYSGGTDSETMVDAFKRRGTKRITLLHLTHTDDAPTESRQWLEKHMEENIRIKHGDAIRHLGWNVRIGTNWEPGSSAQAERTITDGRYTSWGADVTFINQWYEDKPNQKILDTLDARSKTCVVYGKEKPEIGLEDGWWVARYISSMFESPFRFDQEVDDVYFFLNGHCPELAIKIAWLKALAMQDIFVSDGILPTESNANSMSLSSSPYYTRLVKAMGYDALSGFLNSSATKNWGWWRKKMLRETTLRSKNTEFKQVGLAKYFDEVLVKTIDNRFLDFEEKMVHGIRSRSYKLFPVNEVLAHRLSEHLKNQDVKKQEVQPWEKNTLQLTDSNKESKI
jgi:hypothetical protein